MSPSPQSSVHHIENLLFFTLLQLSIIIVTARLAGIAARKVGQPAAVGEMIAGLMLGPSLLGALFPETFKWLFKSVSAEPVTIISQIGLVLLMFQIGLDFEFGHLKNKNNRKALIGISIGSIALPFVCGFALGWISHESLAPTISKIPYCLFAAVALSITAVPIMGRILREFGLTVHPVGVIAITAAAVNDVVGWFLLTVIAALALSQFNPASSALQLGMIVAFLLVCWFVVRPLLRSWLSRFNITADSLPASSMTTMLAVTMIAGICTYKLGVFAIFGGFIIGTLVHDHPHFAEAWRKQVGQFVLVFFLPIFFTFTGLRTNIVGLDSLEAWLWGGAYFFVAVATKLVGSYLGARAGGLAHNDSLIIGSLMNTRALMELIVLNIGYDLGFIPQSLFTILVVMAIGTTIMTGPLLRLLLPRIGHKIPMGVEA